MSYRIEDLKKCFEAYVLEVESEFNLTDKIEVHGESRTVKWLLTQLSTCNHVVPGALCEYLGLRQGTNYAEAINSIYPNIEK